MKKISMILIIITCFYSCDKKVYFDIPQNEKPLLNNNDTVCFSDSTNNIDSFLIKITHEYNISDKRYYHEVITIQYNNINTTGSINEFYVEHLSSIHIYVDGYYPQTLYNIDTININGVNYQPVFLLKSTGLPETIPKSIYYSNKYGILRYDFSDSSSFKIISK